MSSSETPLLPRLYSHGKLTGKRDSSFTAAAHKWPEELLNSAGLSESSMLQMRLLICIVAHKLPKRLPGDVTAFESPIHL